LKELREKKKLLKNKYTKVACCRGRKKAAAMQSVMEATTFLMLIKERRQEFSNLLLTPAFGSPARCTKIAAWFFKLYFPDKFDFFVILIGIRSSLRNLLMVW